MSLTGYIPLTARSLFGIMDLLATAPSVFGNDAEQHARTRHPDAGRAGRDVYDNSASKRGTRCLTTHRALRLHRGCGAVSYLIFRLVVRGARWFSPIAMSIAIRIMGLLLAAVAIQFILNGIKVFHAQLITPMM